MRAALSFSGRDVIVLIDMLVLHVAGVIALAVSTVFPFFLSCQLISGGVVALAACTLPCFFNIPTPD